MTNPVGDLPIPNNIVREIADLAEERGYPRAIGDNGVPFTVIPKNCQLVSLQEYSPMERPLYKRGSARLDDADSFIRWFNRFKGDDSRIFADPDATAFTAIIDYHAAGSGPGGFQKLTAAFGCPLSTEFATWKAKNKQPMAQAEFAEFVEENLPDITTPKPASMLEMSRDMKARSDADFSQATRLDNGQIQFKYSETIKGSYGAGNAEIPEQFFIGIPVFVGGPKVNMKVWFRYRIREGKLALWFDIWRIKQIQQEAFGLMVKEVAEKTSCDVYLGRMLS